MALKITVAPTAEPVTVGEALAHCRIDHSDDNAMLLRLIAAARRRVETTLRRSLMPQTLRLSLDAFPAGAILLPRPPVTAVTTVAYTDLAGDSQTLADYQLDTEREPARLLPAYGDCWPGARDQANAVQVTYQAGYATAEAVPQTIKLAILMLVAHWYEHRESAMDEGKLSETPQAVEFLLGGERVVRFA